MAVPNTPSAQFFPSASFRLTDPVVYAQIVATYGFGTPIIYGVSPATLSSTYSAPVVNNPSTPDYSNLPAVFTLDAESTVLGTPISTSLDGVQTLTGQDYTDPHGNHFTSVTWEWAVEVQFLTVRDGGKFEVEIVNYTGDGTSDRLIPTTLDLSSGVVAIWGCGGANGLGTNEANFFRHNNPTMAGTAVCAINSAPLAGGITDFQSGGFLVTAGVSSLNYANTSGIPYTALVCKDSTFDNRFMQVGTYTGLAGGSLQVHAQQGSSVVTYISGIHFEPSMTGQTVTDPSANPYTFTYVSPTSGTILPPYIPIVSNPTPLTFSNTARDIPVLASADSAAVQLTHAWIWNSGVAYKSVDIPSTTSVDMQSGPNNAMPLSTMITSLNVGSFGVAEPAGPNQSVNTNSKKYDYVTLCASADFLAKNFFSSGQRSTPASLPDTVTGIPFQPHLLFGRQGSTATPTSGTIFRTTVHSGTNSTAMSLPSGTNNVGSTGLTSITADGFTAQVAVAYVTGDPYWWWAWTDGSTDDLIDAPTPNWVKSDDLPLPDGTTASIEQTLTQQESPGPDWSFSDPANEAQWWCYPSLGLSIFQIDSPGFGWVMCTGPASINGWYMSSTGFADPTTIVSAGRPADPRPWEAIQTWVSVGNLNVYGGSPAACMKENSFIYPASGYTTGTDDPPIRLFNGRSDQELCRLPPSSGVKAKAAMTFIAANDTIYLTSWDAGTSSSTWTGRVFELNATSGQLTQLGATFAAGELPYALCWYSGMLWCGTNNGIGTVGKVYFFRPNIDTTWNLDYSTSTDSAGGVTSMASFRGNLFIGTDNASGSHGKVIARTPLGVYAVSLSGPGTALNNGFPAMSVFVNALFASYWDVTGPTSLVKKFDGTTWTTVQTGTDDTLKPYILLPVQNTEMYVLGGGRPYDACVLVTADGDFFENLTGELPDEVATLTPMFGAVGTFQ